MLCRTDWKAPGAAKPFVAGSLVALSMNDLMRSDWNQVPLACVGHMRVLG